jgi:hypothetical protein
MRHNPISSRNQRPGKDRPGIDLEGAISLENVQEACVLLTSRQALHRSGFEVTFVE